MQGWYYVKSLTGQRHDRVQTESQQLQSWTAVSTLLGLVSKLYEVISWLTDIHILTIRWWWPQMELESKFLPIGQSHMQNAWQGRTGKIQNIMLLFMLVHLVPQLRSPNLFPWYDISCKVWSCARKNSFCRSIELDFSTVNWEANSDEIR